jgi:AcrR family transcriptional regulator
MPIPVDKKEKREKILNAAIQVFSKKGLKDTKISDIAETAGIGKGTVYEYFKSKNEVFAATFHFFMERFEEVMSRRLFRIHDPLEKIRAYFSAWSEMLEGDYLDYLEIILDFWAHGIRQRDKAWVIDLNKLYSENRKILDNLLSECITLGEIKPVDTKVTASIMLGALDGLLIQWIMNRDLFKMREATELLVETMIKGLKNEK